MAGQPFMVPSIILLIISIPLVTGKIPQNRFYGIRTRKTMSDERIWYASNRFGGWLFILSSLIYFGIAAFVPYSDDSSSVNWWVHIGGLLLPLAVSILIIHLYTKRL